MNIRKAAILGCGYVGAASAFALMNSGLFSELVLLDLDRSPERPGWIWRRKTSASSGISCQKSPR